MCEYCEEDKVMMEKEVIPETSWGMGNDFTKINLREALRQTERIGVFIDRGYLRMVTMDDCQCIESGEKIKISYCPMCGEEIKHGW